MTKTLRVFIIRLVACEITAKHEIIFGLDNLSKALHILRNHLVRLKACLENQISCTGLMIVKQLGNAEGDVDLLILYMNKKIRAGLFDIYQEY